MSRASPATVSFEHEFIVEKYGTVPIVIPTPIVTSGGTNGAGDSTSNKTSNTSSGSILAVVGGGGSDGAGPLTSTSPVEEEMEEVETDTTDRQDELEALVDNLPKEVTESPIDDRLPLAMEGFAAAAFFTGVFGDSFTACISLGALILLVIYITQLISTRFAEKNTHTRLKNIIWFIGLLIGATLAFLFSKTCVAVGLLAILLGLVAFNLYKNKLLGLL